MREGFTTGSCAAAAAKAAATMLFSRKVIQQISIRTPKGVLYTPEILDIRRSVSEVSCAVEKDGGDDPDITSGLLIYATVRLETPYTRKKQERWKEAPSEPEYWEAWKEDSSEPEYCEAWKEAPTEPEKREVKSGCNDDPNTSEQAEVARRKESLEEDKSQENGIVIEIDGGEGVGRVTKPGLEQPVGSAAINRIPRKMIDREVREVCERYGYMGRILVTISVPNGTERAAKTFNPRLGITGGISILGTSGIVEPMSAKALLETIRLELVQRYKEGAREIAVSPGNYGLDYMQRTYGFDLDRSVKCSNYIGETVDMATQIGYGELLLAGHIGKLIKVAGGIMNTHSREADSRLEILAAAAIREGADLNTARRILGSVTTEEAIVYLNEALQVRTMSHIIEKIQFYLEKRSGQMSVQCILFSNEAGELAKTDGALELLERLKGR